MECVRRGRAAAEAWRLRAGGLLGAVELPAVVFVAPHCIPASCGAPAVLPLPAATDSGRTQPPTTAADAAQWAARQRK